MRPALLLWLVLLLRRPHLSVGLPETIRIGTLFLGLLQLEKIKEMITFRSILPPTHPPIPTPLNETAGKRKRIDPTAT